MGDGLAHRRADAALANPVAVDHQHLLRQRLTAQPLAIAGVTVGEDDYVLGTDQRPGALDVGDYGRAVASCEGQVTRRRRSSDRVRLGLVEVGVAIDVKQAKAPTAA